MKMKVLVKVWMKINGLVKVRVKMKGCHIGQNWEKSER